MSSILDPTSMTLPPLIMPAFRSVMVSFAIPLTINFCADSGTPVILSRWAFRSNTVASYANDISCFTLLNTMVNSTCSGISHSSDSSVDSEEHAAISAGASMCDLSSSTIGLLSIAVFEVPLDIREFGSRFSVESPFSEAGEESKRDREYAKFLEQKPSVYMITKAVRNYTERFSF